MILKIAWRNVWRNKVRSLVVIIAIALGLWAGTFASGFYEGMMEQKINDVIENEFSHFQFHDTLFREEFALKHSISSYTEVGQALKADDQIVGVSARVLVMSMFQSANKSGSIKLVGIHPDNEALVTRLDKKLIEGAYFEGVKRNPILVSSRTAEDYNLKLKSKVVLTLQDLEGEIVAASFRVVGIYRSNNGMFDDMNAFVQAGDIQTVLNLGDQFYHQIAVLTSSHALAEPYALKYAQQFQELEVLPWLDLATGMRYMVEASGTFSLIFVGIILVALLFSIVNTMLMAVMERTREIGMLKAIGLNRRKVFSMIMLETVFLSFVGTPVGLLVAYLFIEQTGSKGIDLGAVGETYSDLGFSAVVYPSLETGSYVSIAVMVFVMSFIAALYPARKALKMNASEAIRKI
ncbi:MAG: FtsX-like permease family protein [Cryomorphaceae bacterium]